MDNLPLLSRIHGPEDVKRLSDDELIALSTELRTVLIDSVLNTGGHLGSNLGIVEITLAMHRVFSSPDDHFIFDVGHQSYVHKILTGRSIYFDTLRQNGGLSGFTKRS
ncbi:MAG: 1-deoxy-D-xylulose-5-phosphate synthase, partial [Clostridia bacterium]|nr:1-deoxy-D-xylulose-5-phosphate synthase [Clostridia bacterium]